MGGGSRRRPQHDVRRQDEHESSPQKDTEQIRVVGHRSSAVMDHRSEPGESPISMIDQLHQ